ncbi:hypothetical protein O1L60_38545 [Streptomyces diastatochromogenes]|nr:hypothetical protein [Streptomyces diastatochromogenes]
MSVRKQLRTALCGLALTGIVVTTAQGPAARLPWRRSRRRRRR